MSDGLDSPGGPNESCLGYMQKTASAGIFQRRRTACRPTVLAVCPSELESTTISGGPRVSVMQAANPRNRDHAAFRWVLDSAGHRRVPIERKMGTDFVIVREVRGQDAFQVSLVEHDEMIKTLSPDRADQAFDVRRLPWRPVCDDDFLDAHVLDALAEVHAVDPVVISYHETRRFVAREGLDDLLGGPSCRWMGGNIEVNDAPPIMSKHNEAVQQLKSYGRHDEEVDRGNAGHVILKGRSPRL